TALRSCECPLEPTHTNCSGEFAYGSYFTDTPINKVLSLMKDVLHCLR
ncbi:MAG: hypothetical protein ACI89J_000729, partial [Hyphomicrobiaceae bacterium]